jgi:type II secretory pathway pseudopilin PulG
MNIKRKEQHGTLVRSSVLRGFRRAFSLVEALIVVTILTILVVLAVPSPSSLARAELLAAAQIFQADFSIMQARARAMSPNEVMGLYMQSEGGVADAGEPWMQDALVYAGSSAGSLQFGPLALLTQTAALGQLARGACCKNANCSFRTPAQCDQIGGKHLGLGTTCDESSCAGSVAGACCFLDLGECEILPEKNCNGDSMAYLGDGTVCGEKTCSGCAADEECGDGNRCTEDTCSSSGSGGQSVCRNKPVSCDDSDVCTNDTCNPAIGCEYTEVVCDEGDACTEGTCDPVKGCVLEPLDCDDGDACTEDTCNPAEGCVSAEKECDDGDACNGVETCDPEQGCIRGVPVVCDDGSFCNGVETCDADGTCIEGEPPCAADYCDEENDVCTECIADSECENAVFCDGTEKCVSGYCLSGSMPCQGHTRCDEQLDRCVVCSKDQECDDANECTQDRCDKGECRNIPREELCAKVGACCSESRGCYMTGESNCDGVYLGVNSMCPKLPCRTSEDPPTAVEVMEKLAKAPPPPFGGSPEAPNPSKKIDTRLLAKGVSLQELYGDDNGDTDGDDEPVIGSPSKPYKPKTGYAWGKFDRDTGEFTEVEQVVFSNEGLAMVYLDADNDLDSLGQSLLLDQQGKPSRDADFCLRAASQSLRVFIHTSGQVTWQFGCD